MTYILIIVKLLQIFLVEQNFYKVYLLFPYGNKGRKSSRF